MWAQPRCGWAASRSATRSTCLPMRTSDFDYPLPEDLIAQHPAPIRDQSRLLVLHRDSGQIDHRRFTDILDYLRPGDLLVMNDSRVFPARLRGRDPVTGGKFEILLCDEMGRNDWWTMIRPGKRAPVGKRVELLDLAGQPNGAFVEVTEVNAEGHRRVRVHGHHDILELAETCGEIPLPPYIERAAGASSATDKERYQTIYAQQAGSIAAPTAGLHFTPELLARIRSAGIQTAFVTLHVGIGTFAPVKADDLADHRMHEERFSVSDTTAAAIAATKANGGRVIAVGTTSVRVLESSAALSPTGAVTAGAGRTSIFIHPPYRFRCIDALVTNFHLPKSTLLMLVSAFVDQVEATAGRDRVIAAYAEAVRERYRFFSYGDAMFLA